MPGCSSAPAVIPRTPSREACDPDAPAESATPAGTAEALQAFARDRPWLPLPGRLATESGSTAAVVLVESSMTRLLVSTRPAVVDHQAGAGGRLAVVRPGLLMTHQALRPGRRQWADGGRGNGSRGHPLRVRRGCNKRRTIERTDLLGGG